MKIPLRIFNESGIEKFREYIESVADGSTELMPESLIKSDEYSAENKLRIEIEQLVFTTKKEITEYLHDIISKLEEEEVYYSTGLWTWLSAFYFDTVCPLIEDGTRKPHAEVRHILNTQHWGRYYRHLLATPVRLYAELGELSKIYLAGSPDRHGDLLEQLASTQEIATARGIVEAATLLYWDESAGGIRRGATSKGSSGKGTPGGVRRFARAIIPQFQMTYDINAMSGEEILKLLPEEFGNWKK